MARPGLISMRTQLGLSQRELAAYLGIAGGVVAMAEAGRRELPQPAYQWLADLTEKVEAEKRTENRGFLPEEESFAEALQRLTAQAREMDWKIRKLQRQREVETGRYQQCRLRLRAVRLMREHLEKTGGGPQEVAYKKHWLAEMEAQTRRRLRTHNATTLALLTLQIEALTTEFEAVHRLVRELENQKVT